MTTEDEEYITVLAEAVAALLTESEGVFVRSGKSKALVHVTDKSVFILGVDNHPDFVHGKIVWVHDSEGTIIKESSDIENFAFRRAKKIFGKLSERERGEIIREFCPRCFKEEKKESCTCGGR